MKCVTCKHTENRKGTGRFVMGDKPISEPIEFEMTFCKKRGEPVDYIEQECGGADDCRYYERKIDHER